jgi:hypothetical protein
MRMFFEQFVQETEKYWSASLRSAFVGCPFAWTHLVGKAKARLRKKVLDYDIIFILLCAFTDMIEADAIGLQTPSI